MDRQQTGDRRLIRDMDRMGEFQRGGGALVPTAHQLACARKISGVFDDPFSPLHYGVVRALDQRSYTEKWMEHDLVDQPQEPSSVCIRMAIKGFVFVIHPRGNVTVEYPGSGLPGAVPWTGEYEERVDAGEVDVS